MLKIRNILFLLLIVLTSCNQNGLGTYQAIENFVTAPFRGIQGYFSDREYDRISAQGELELTQSENETQISCEVSSDDNPSSQDMYTDLMEATRASACECIAWGSCSKEICSCSNLCPDNFDIFKKPPFQRKLSDLSATENSLSFRNIGAMKLSNIEGTQGYCWGHASLTSKFNRLSFFKPDQKEMRENLNAAPDSQARQEALETYKDIIDDIYRNKVREIPGYKNLQELSEEPDLQSYIADKAAKSWAQNAMTLQGLTVALSTRPMSASNANSLVEDVLTKLDKNQQPQIVFTEKGNAGKTHTVLVSHSIVDKSGKSILCIRDNNYPPRTNESCINKIYQQEDGSLYYNQWGPLGGAKMAHNDNADAVAQFHALKEHCNVQNGCS